MSHRRHPVWKTLLTIVVDAAAICGGLTVAYWIRFESDWMRSDKGWVPENYRAFLPVACAFWLLALRIENLYRRRSKFFDFNIARKIVTGSVLALFFFFAFAFYERREPQWSRALVPIVFGSVVGCLIAARVVLHAVFRRLTSNRVIGMTRAVVLGGGDVAVRVHRAMKAHPEHGVAPLGLVVDDSVGRSLPAGSEDVPILGRIEELERILVERNVDEVILAQRELDRERIPGILIQCERQLADFRIVPDTTEILFSGMVVETMSGIPLLGVRPTPLQGWNAALKRIVDATAAAAGLVLLSPVLLLVAWLVKRRDGGPAFFVQERMGLDGRSFRIYKFRTMGPDAERETGPVFADDEDPRCTPLGAFLRRYRIDEFPQLVNVLKGEMSLVGPRPERPFFVERFRGDIPKYMSRHKVKSGITGWAQINGLCGKHGTISERLQYDLYYVENWSLWLDMKILFLTFYRTWMTPSAG